MKIKTTRKSIQNTLDLFAKMAGTDQRLTIASKDRTVSLSLRSSNMQLTMRIPDATADADDACCVDYRKFRDAMNTGKLKVIRRFGRFSAL